jgi:two-component system sensor histidine kinase YesM
MKDMKRSPVFHKPSRTLRAIILSNFLTLMTVMLLLLAILSQLFWQRSLIEKQGETSGKILDEITRMIDFYLEEMEDTIRIIGADEAIQWAIFHHEEVTPLSLLMNSREIDELLSNIIQMKYDIDQIILIDTEGRGINYMNKSIRLGYNFFDRSWFPDLSSSYQTFFLRTMSDYTYGDDPVPHISAVSRIQNFYQQTDHYGAVQVDLKRARFTSIISRLDTGYNGFSLILDSRGEILVHAGALPDTPIDPILPDRSSVRLGSREYLLFRSRCENAPWDILYFLDRAEVLRDSRQYGRFLLSISLLTIFLGTLISIILASLIERPLLELTLRMKEISGGNFDVKLGGQSCREFQQVALSFNTMGEKVRNLIDKVYNLQILQKESELKVLQAHINPHFLYNSLQAIQSLSSLGRNREINEAVNALSSVFRYSLDQEPDALSSVCKELGHVNEYATIQKYLLTRPCDIDIVVPNEYMELGIPRFTFQPLVENIFIHGFRELQDRYAISIRIEKSGTVVAIRITDNGCGISGEALVRIKSQLDDDNRISTDHIGLANIHKRLQHHFGKEAGLRIESRVGGGTVVTAFVPLDTWGDNDR